MKDCLLIICNVNKRIEQLKEFYSEYINDGSQLMNISTTKRILEFPKNSFSKGNLRSNKSEENFNIVQSSRRPKISDSLKKTIESQSVEKTARARLDNRSQRGKVPSSMVISNEISSKLYQDAVRRQSAKQINIERSK